MAEASGSLSLLLRAISASPWAGCPSSGPRSACRGGAEEVGWMGKRSQEELGPYEGYPGPQSVLSTFGRD